MQIIETSRLILRPWNKEDLESFVRLNADPLVMQYFPSTKSREETIEEFQRIQAHFEKHGWGLWSVTELGHDNFIGFIGLQHVGFSAPFTPAVEIGWRLFPNYWGRGYATEGALAALKFGFETLHLKEIVAFTPISNRRSRAVMERIGMHHNDSDDFNHPKLAQDHPLSHHALYRIFSKS